VMDYDGIGLPDAACFMRDSSDDSMQSCCGHGFITVARLAALFCKVSWLLESGKGHHLLLKYLTNTSGEK